MNIPLHARPFLLTQQKALQLYIRTIITENMLIIRRPLKTVAVNNKKRNLFNVIALKGFLSHSLTFLT
jgi:hypothetical protein